MKKLCTYIVAATLFAATGASAGCYADYKAKRDNPLKLHYGVIELPQKACTYDDVPKALISARLAKGGWTLLNVLSTFDDSGLERRRSNAGQFFLRY